jgi:hypothetical protein
MASVTDLLNTALARIGQSRITAIDDGSTNANHCQTIYPMRRDYALTLAHWTFNDKRIILAQEAQTPPFEYAFQYPLPSDFLGMREYWGSDGTVALDPEWWGTIQPPLPWQLGINTPAPSIPETLPERRLFSNATSVAIRYGARVENPDQWSAPFFEFVMTLTCGYLAGAIAKNIPMMKALIEEAMGVHLPMAAAQDGQQKPVRAYQVPDLLWGR